MKHPAIAVVAASLALGFAVSDAGAETCFIKQQVPVPCHLTARSGEGAYAAPVYRDNRSYYDRGDYDENYYEDDDYYVDNDNYYGNGHYYYPRRHYVRRFYGGYAPFYGGYAPYGVPFFGGPFGYGYGYGPSVTFGFGFGGGYGGYWGY